MELSKQKVEQQNFRDEFEIQKEIIRRYDEVMNTKASKLAIKTLEANMEKLVDIKLEITKKELEKLRDEALGQLDDINDFKQGLPRTIKGMVEQSMKNIKQMIQEGGAEDILGIDSGAKMKKVLMMKADKIDLERMY